MPFAATWMDLEIVILSEVKSDRERQVSHDIAYVWNILKNGTNELIYKTEVEARMWKTILWLSGDKEIGTDIYTLLCIT